MRREDVDVSIFPWLVGTVQPQYRTIWRQLLMFQHLSVSIVRKEQIGKDAVAPNECSQNLNATGRIIEAGNVAPLPTKCSYNFVHGHLLHLNHPKAPKFETTSASVYARLESKIKKGEGVTQPLL
ncbi:hypothetical protein M8818_002026 [Zalaria obscura]|uniref:Uncharacterized protein n=1 Tax=Zalaria obscura TaxID=2024903 RepID=A0ACC3SKT4_9PEZI